MYESLIKKAVNQHKLGDGEIRVSNLGAGENNISMLAKVDGRKYVFRIGLRKEYEENMKVEFDYMCKLPPKIGPEAILFDKSKKIIPRVYSVLSFIDGKHLKNWRKEHLRIHARKLAELHKHKYSYCGRIGSPKKKKFDMYKYLMKDYQEWKKHYPFEKDAILGEIFNSMKKHWKEQNHLFTTMKKFSWVHSDPSIPNILLTKEGIRYIDWEWTKIRDNAEDVQKLYYEDFSAMPWKIQLKGSRLRTYLNEYRKYITDKTLVERKQRSSLIWFSLSGK